MAQTAATVHTAINNEKLKMELNFNDRQDFDDATRGFIATIATPDVMREDGKVSYSISGWDFLKEEAPATANPSFW